MDINIVKCWIGGFIGLLGIVLYLGISKGIFSGINMSLNIGVIMDIHKNMGSERYVDNIVYFIKTILGVIVDIIIINLFLIVYFGIIFIFVRLMSGIKI